MRKSLAEVREVTDYGGENEQGTQIKPEEVIFVVVVRPTGHHVVADIK